MVWSKIDADGRPRYIRINGQNVILTPEKKGNLAEEIPSGWDVTKLPNNRLKLVRK